MPARKQRTRENQQKLRALIVEATADCYGEDEQFAGLCATVQENVALPFLARVIGEAVRIIDLEPADDDFGIMAICERNGKKHRVDLNSIEWVEPYPEGFEWIEAYLAWREWNSWSAT
jgi:hypothetical protein